jgi:hypothetical protein
MWKVPRHRFRPATIGHGGSSMIERITYPQGNSTETVTERSIGHAFGSASFTAAAEEKQSIDAALGEFTLGHK